MSTPPNDGGPAFPLSGTYVEQKGMTLRDYFAAKVMAGHFANPQARAEYEANTHGVTFTVWVASRSYHMADAMINRRSDDF